MRKTTYQKIVKLKLFIQSHFTFQKSYYNYQNSTKLFFFILLTKYFNIKTFALIKIKYGYDIFYNLSVYIWKDLFL